MPRIPDTRYTQKYPWEQWLAKKRVTLTKGEDFDCDCMMLQQTLRNNMQRPFFRERCGVEPGQVTTSIDHDNGTITIMVAGRKR